MHFLHVIVFAVTDDLASELHAIIDPNSLPFPITTPLPWPQCQWTVFPTLDFELTK